MVIEVGQFKFNELTADEFAALDKAMVESYVAHQPGFVRRSAGYIAEDNKWVFIAYWKDAASAQNSTDGFMDSELTADFRAHIDFDSFTNGVYEQTMPLESAS